MNAARGWGLHRVATRALPVALGLLVLGACATRGPTPDADCAASFATLHAATAATRDAQYHLLDDFPGLRSDRVLAALGAHARSPAARRLWLQHLAAHDREASAIEHDNLPLPQRRRLPEAAHLEHCRQQQIARLSQDPAAFEQAVRAAQVPSDYRRWARALGLYPLAKPFYRQAIAAWQREAAAQQAPTEHFGWLSYRPPAGTVTTTVRLREDALGLPHAEPAQLATLFARHAPEIRIAQRSAADRLGTPRFARDGQRRFDAHDPVLYRHHGWSRLHGRWHLQLIYQFWFRERPRAGPVDIYAGALDGLLWRVTLDADGNARLFDAIHPCGCWHAFFLPADSPLQFRQPAGEEQRLARRLSLPGSQAATLWLRGGDHALLWVDARRTLRPASRYRFADLDALRQLGHPDGQRSLYDRRGLVPGSQRLERWLLWPSGVLSPGAMRQWGRHASAFIGEAHLDDPDLLGRYFSRPAASE
ncbi:MAG TPA: hypothetical protein VIZ86_09060 [Pseudomonas sp.]